MSILRNNSRINNSEIPNKLERSFPNGGIFISILSNFDSNTLYGNTFNFLHEKDLYVNRGNSQIHLIFIINSYIVFK